MKINKIAFGNGIDAYIEDRFTDKVNIIFSDDNNKGKTIVFQSILYSLGNEPIFPSGFPFKDYYYYLSLSTDEPFEILRKNSTFVVNYNDRLFFFDTVTEFKYFFNENIYQLPLIIKDNKEKMVDLCLLFEMFFVGQDKRNPSNVINKGYYNKKDFLSMLCSINGYPLLKIDENIKEIDMEIKKKNEEIMATKKLATFFELNPSLASYINKSKDLEKHLSTQKKLQDVNNDIVECKKKRNREINRKIKLETLISELRSLNRSIAQGKIICAECGSDIVTYQNNGIKFDVNNEDVRKQVISAIQYQIAQKEEIIYELSIDINNLQNKTKSILNETPEEIRKLLLYTDDLLQNDELDEKLHTLMIELDSLKNSKKITNSKDEKANKKKLEMLKLITQKMNSYYRKIDPKGNLMFDDIFTKKQVTFSGSEGQEYYFCRILAINEYFNHDFPIIIDSFRDGEVSSRKEKIMINHYRKVNKQVILSSTLKYEEYNNTKYSNIENVNAIDYSINDDSQLLQEKYNKDFMGIVKRFGVIIN